MPFIEVEVEAGANSDMSLLRMFDAREEPREVTQVFVLRRDGTEGLCTVTGWSIDGPCPAYAASVWDSGDGVALLIYGGDEGIRLKHADSNSSWDMADASQWGEPCLLLEASTYAT
jgi:hypothetical protein